MMLRGIFIGAKVSRGTDWEWSNQDGGRGTSKMNNSIRKFYIISLFIGFSIVKPRNLKKINFKVLLL